MHYKRESVRLEEKGKVDSMTYRSKAETSREKEGRIASLRSERKRTNAGTWDRKTRRYSTGSEREKRKLFSEPKTLQQINLASVEGVEKGEKVRSDKRGK